MHVCAQTRPRFKFSSERVLGQRSHNPCELQGTNPLYQENSPQRRIEPMTLHQAGQRAQHTTNELLRPPKYANNGPASPNFDTVTPSSWLGSHQNTDFEVIGMIQPENTGTDLCVSCCYLTSVIWQIALTFCYRCFSQRAGNRSGFQGAEGCSVWV